MKKLLITGATGKQGGGVLEALLSSPNPSFEVYALTRDASSTSSKRLSSKYPSIKLVEGNTCHPTPIFKQTGPLYGVFCVTVPPQEELQGKGMIDAALENGVEHFIFTSVDRGTKSDDNPTDVPHFITKHNVELYLKEKAPAGSKMKWTILRPVAFYDNLTPDFMGKAFGTMWNQIGEKPLQLISCRDIGKFAAKVFQSPEKYSGKAITLAGDELNFRQASQVFKTQTGEKMPETFGIVGTMIKGAVSDMGKMFRFFNDEGYGCDIPALKAEFPELQDFSTWLEEDSKFKMIK